MKREPVFIVVVPLGASCRERRFTSLEKAKAYARRVRSTGTVRVYEGDNHVAVFSVGFLTAGRL